MDSVFYLSFSPSRSNQGIIEIEFFSLSSDLTHLRIQFFKTNIPLYKDETFDKFNLIELKQFQRYFGIIEKNNLNLLGQEISLKFGKDSLYTTCHLGRRNPFYSNREVLVLWSQKHLFYKDVVKKSSNLVYNLIMIGAVLGITGGLVALFVAIMKGKESIGKRSIRKIETI